VLTVGLCCLILGALIGLGWESWPQAMLRVFALGLAGLLAYALLERWPPRLPGWLARWVLQVAGVAMIIPLATLALYLATTAAEAPPFWRDPDRLSGFLTLTIVGMLVAPWIALAALVRQKDALARHQALALDLQRSQLERQALDARLQLIHRQIAPHFLFNTLANVQALIETGSPRAAELMRSLIAYLRAAVPRLHAPATLADELQLVRAYLELMHMRMPDRLTYAIQVDGDPETAACPGTAVLTLVENAIRHGIDPVEEGGDITVRVWPAGGVWHVLVEDTGLGLNQKAPGMGTGLATLRDRLALEFGPPAQVRIAGRRPRGVSAELVLPMRSRP